MINDQILNEIDNIDITRSNAEVGVIESMISIIDKSLTISENCENDDISSFSIFQEGSILDDVKKKSKKDDNKLITVIKFIPRLIIAIIDSIKKSMKDNKKNSEKAKNGSKKLNSLSKKEKEEKVKELNKKFNGDVECYVDEKSGKIKFKNTGSRLLKRIGMDMALIYNTYKLVKRIKGHMDVLNPSDVRNFIDDCDKVIHGDKSVSKLDLFDGGLDSIGEILGDLFTLSGEITLVLGQISERTDNIIKKDMIKDVPNEKKQETLQSLNQLASRLTKINALITGALGSVKVLTKWGNFISDIGHDFKKDTDLRNEALEEVKKENPRNNNESFDDYINRIYPLVSPKMKEIKNKKIEEAKRAHKAEWDARRNKNNDGNPSDK